MYNVEVTFFKTGKPTNSTLQPTFDSAHDTKLNCELFEPFDMINPTIIVDNEHRDKSVESEICKYNYCYANTPLNRYYWITNWERRDGLWYGYCSGDVLATFRTDILNTTQYVLRTSNPNLWDNTIPDTMYSYKYSNYKAVAYDSQVQDGPVWNDFSKISENYSNYSKLPIGYIRTVSPSYISIDPSTKDAYSVPNNINLTQITLERIAALQGKLYQDAEHINLRDFITRLYLLPFEAPNSSYDYDASPANYPIYSLIVGSYKDAKSDNFQAISPYNPTYGNNKCGKTWDVIDVRKMSVPSPYGMHYAIKPMAIARTVWKFDIGSIKKSINYTNSGQYNTWSIVFPPFGKISIDPNTFINDDTLYISALTDIATGDSTLYWGIPGVDGSPYNIIATANVSMDIQLSTTIVTEQAYRRQSVQNGFNIAQNAINNVASSIQGSMAGASMGGVAGAIAGGIAGGVSTVLPVAESIWSANDRPPMQVSASVTGAVGCALNAARPILVVESYELTDRYDYRFGRPICKTKKLSEMGKGYYCLCQNANFGGAGIGWNATSTERQAIENALNGGVYLE